MQTTASGLKYRVIKEGTGSKPAVDDQVQVHYTGRLDDGTVFDSSVQRGDPIVATPGDFIPGWREALTLMPEGSKWEVEIPSNLAYGERGAGGVIPPNATLHFEMELLKVMTEADLKAAEEKFVTEQAEYLVANAKADGVKVTASGLQYKVLKAGPAGGKSPKKGQMVSVHYEGKLIDGSVFDSSFERGQPAEFPSDRLIQGWVEALAMMHEGDEWELVIPAGLGYGDHGAGQDIPPHATLIFRVQLVKVLG